jgi:hypothetical protein
MPGGTGVIIGANRQYAATHQFGATIRAKNKKALTVPIADGSLRLLKQVTIPARPFLGLSEGDKRASCTLNWPKSDANPPAKCCAIFVQSPTFTILDKYRANLHAAGASGSAKAPF